MKAYRVRSGRRIAPFGDLARDLSVGARSLGDWQAAAVLDAGLQLVDVDDWTLAGEGLCFSDDVFFSAMALRQFLAEALSRREPVVLAFPDDDTQRYLGPLSEAEKIPGATLFDVFFSAGASASRSLREWREMAKPLSIELREKRASVQLPPLAGEERGGAGSDVPVTARVVAQVRHWVHLLRLAHLCVGVTILDELRRSPRRALSLRLMRRQDPWRLARRLNFIHPTARVHPTAELESAVIGPGSVIRAHAHVIRSVLGQGVDVGDHSAVVGCALGDRVSVMRASYFALCAAMPGAHLSNAKCQLSLFGRDCFLTTSALLVDAKLEGHVRVEDQGRLVSVGTPFLGVCVGHRSVIGARVTVLAGRAIGNGLTVVPRPEELVSETGVHPEGRLLVVKDGRLVPLE